MVAAVTSVTTQNELVWPGARGVLERPAHRQRSELSVPVGTTFAVPETRAEKVESGAVVSIRESMRSS